MKSFENLLRNKSFTSFIRNSFLSISAFGLGVLYERKYRINADIGPSGGVGGENIFIQPLNQLDGDVVDSPIRWQQQLKQQQTNNLPSQSNRIAEITRFGFPSMDSLRSYKNFILSYDRRNRIANWVLEYITMDDLDSKEYDRKGLEFFEDQSFHQFFRSTNSDYKGSGYDRGHLAAAGNYRNDPIHIRETYVLSNIAPQIGKGFNRDKWNDLEKYCRRKLREIKSGIWICTGPLYLPRKDQQNGKQYINYEVIGRNNVAVPTHFFKVLLYQFNQKWYMECFMMPNQYINEQASIKSYRVNPEIIERSAGILLFNKIIRNEIHINP